METLLLAITVVSLIVALVMSVTAWRLARDEKQRSAARVAALSLSAFDLGPREDLGLVSSSVEQREPHVVPIVSRDADGDSRPGRSVATAFRERTDAEPEKAPWAPSPFVARYGVPEPVREIAHSSGFLGTVVQPPASGSGGRQRSLAIAAAVLFVGLATGVVWMMSGPRGTSAAAMGPNLPLELVSLRHERQNTKLAVSGLVRNPVTGRTMERLTAVVFLFDQQGTFVTSATAPVDFMKLGVGDESPFVVAIEAPPTVARYRVSFRTEDGVVPHIDRRGATPLPTAGEQPVTVTLK